jgi:general secretion pathway protein A
MTGPFSSFFDLRDNPFRANPDPRYLFLTQQTKEILDQIIDGIRGRKGLLLLTGEVGTGKTVLLNRLMEWLEQERTPKAFIFNSHMKASELLDLVLADFGVPFSANRGAPLAHLHTWLQDRHCAGQTPVLFVDEAQGLTPRTLEELRMLLNLQTSEGSLLQIVLCGQPEFEETLNRPELRQLRQRIALRCRTAPLTLEETQNYIEARLRIAGGSGAAVFHPEAVEALLLYSRGLPRVLNALCEQSLMRAAREKIRPVPGRIVGAAARDLQYDEIRPFTPHFAADDAVFSSLLQDAPGFAGTPEFSTPAAATPLAQDAPLDVRAPGIPSRVPKPLAAAAAAGASAGTPDAHFAGLRRARESGPGAPRISHAPIAFPSRRERQSAPSPVADEIIERLASASKTAAPIEPRIVQRPIAPRIATPLAVARKQAGKQENDFRKRWTQQYVSAMNGLKSALSAIALESRSRLAQVQTRALPLFKSVSGQLSAWRNRNWNVSTINFKWPGFQLSEFASSCLHWLRAPSHPTKRRLPSPKPPTPALHTGSSARIRATQPLGSHPLPRAARSPFVRGPDKTPRVAASILQWLQQPSHSVRERKSPRASSTHLT